MSNKDFENFHTKTIMPRKASSVSEAQKLIEPLVDKPITNTKLGITATISNKIVGKLGSSVATKKSISPRLHAKAVANIDILFQNAEFDVTHQDTKRRPEVAQVHRLGSFMLDEATQEYVPAMLTMIEYNDGHGNKLYTVEIMDIEIPKNPAHDCAGMCKPVGQSTDGNNTPQVPITDFIAKVIQEFEKVKQNSKKIMPRNKRPAL